MNEILPEENWKILEKLVTDRGLKKVMKAEINETTQVFLMIYNLSEALLKARDRIEELENASNNLVTESEMILH